MKPDARASFQGIVAVSKALQDGLASPIIVSGRPQPRPPESQFGAALQRAFVSVRGRDSI